MSKNFFGFTAFVATASLGLGLMVAGCGDGGDTTPNPLDHVVKTGTVTFNYNVLAKAAAGKTDITNDIKSVKYSFSGVSTDSQLVKTPFRTDATAPYEFVAGEEDQPDSVEVANVDVDSTTVVAVYYGENDTIVGWGVDTLKWTGDGSATSPYVAVVDIPTLNLIDAGANVLDLSASEYVINKGERTELVATIYANAKDAQSGVGADITPFVTIKGMDQKGTAAEAKPFVTPVMDAQQQPVLGLYQGAEFGTIDAAKVTATFGTFEPVALEQDILVTDAFISGITLERFGNATVEGPEPAAGEKDTRYSRLIFFDDSKTYQSMGAKEATFTYDPDKTCTAAIGKQEFAVSATWTLPKGSTAPKPEATYLYLEDVKFSATCKNEEVKYNVTPDGILHVTALPAAADIQVVASYTNADVQVEGATEGVFETTVESDPVTIKAFPGTATVGYSTREGDGTTESPFVYTAVPSGTVGSAQAQFISGTTPGDKGKVYITYTQSYEEAASTPAVTAQTILPKTIPAPALKVEQTEQAEHVTITQTGAAAEPPEPVNEYNINVGTTPTKDAKIIVDTEKSVDFIATKVASPVIYVTASDVISVTTTDL